MAELSINEVTTYRWTFQEDVMGYAAAEIPAIGVWRAKLADFGEQRGAELLGESGLSVSHLHWAGGFTGSDGRTFHESLQDGLDAVGLAAQLNAKCIVVYSGGRAGHTSSHARRLFRDALREICGLARDVCVEVGIEPMHPACAEDWTFLTSLDKALEMIEECDQPNLKLVFDTYQLCHDESVLDRIPEFASRVGLVQLADGHAPPDKEQNRSPLGKGRLPLEEACRRFLDCGYDGFFDVELIGEEIETADYADLIRHSRDVFHQLTVPTA